jgi:two-component system, OmpR family, phosphate regulon response regulator OmpR
MTEAQRLAVFKLLVVDDDARLRHLLQRILKQEGFDVFTAEDAPGMDRHLLRHSVDLIVLDVMMPGEDGISACKRLREAGNQTPIIMLTAKRDENDHIEGLDSGADDYLNKPFNPKELISRIRAVLRRRPKTELAGAPTLETQSVDFGPFHFDLSQRTLTKDGVDVPLTTGEFAMLKVLVQNAKQPLSRDKLAQLARGREFEAFDRSLDVQISRLRKIVEPDAATPRYIQTVWGLGYVFIPDAPAKS